MSADLSEMEVKNCPHCSAEYEWHPTSEAFIHVVNGGCHMNLSMLFTRDKVESHNRRSPPAELVEAWRVYTDNAREDVYTLELAIEKICEVEK